MPTRLAPQPPRSPAQHSLSIAAARLNQAARPRHAEIPIALAAPSCLTSRGFLPWRLSDTGPGACRTVVMGRHPKPFTKEHTIYVRFLCFAQLRQE